MKDVKTFLSLELMSLNFYNKIENYINSLSSPGEGASVFTYPYFGAGAPAEGELKGLILFFYYF